MIYIRTTAYNASKTLRRTIESVLHQTYGEFQYYLIDNGSTDRGATRAIVEEYAKHDTRIKPFFNQRNHAWDDNEDAILLPHHIGPEEYFCLLDADDEYALTFFEEILEFMERNHLDIAACGSDFIREVDNQLIGRRLLRKDLILQGNRFAYFFPIYFQFMRTVWGKMFKGKTLLNTILDSNSPKIPKAYGNDTFFTMQTFRDANRVGILAKPLHRYYISPKSVSYNFDPERSKCDRILRQAALDFLEPYGSITPENRDFLNAVHANATKDTLNVILNAKISVIEKMHWIKELYSDEGITELVLSQASEVIKIVSEMKEKTLNWLVNQAECSAMEGAKLSADIMLCLFSEYDMFTYLLYIKKRNPDFITRLKEDRWIEQHLLKAPIICNISANLAFILADVIKYIIKNDYAKAWEFFLKYNDIEIDDNDIEPYYLLGQNLAAFMENETGYIFFKKEWISYLIEQMRLEEAKVELDEFAKILPNDEVFEQLRKKYIDSLS